MEGPRLKRIVIECACVQEQHSWRKDKTNHARKGPLDCSFTWVSEWLIWFGFAMYFIKNNTNKTTLNACKDISSLYQPTTIKVVVGVSVTNVLHAWLHHVLYVYLHLWSKICATIIVLKWLRQISHLDPSSLIGSSKFVPRGHFSVPWI